MINRHLSGDSVNHVTTLKGKLLDSVPPAMTTWTVPVVAPVGTAAAMRLLEFTVKVAALPLKVTLVTPVRLVPRILTVAPAWPDTAAFPRTDRHPQTS